MLQLFLRDLPLQAGFTVIDKQPSADLKPVLDVSDAIGTETLTETLSPASEKFAEMVAQKPAPRLWWNFAR